MGGPNAISIELLALLQALPLVSLRDDWSQHGPTWLPSWNGVQNLMFFTRSVSGKCIVCKYVFGEI